MINSGTSQDKLGGLLAIQYLATVIPEVQVIAYVNKFLSVIFRQFTMHTDGQIFRRNAEVFGKLVKLGGSKIAQVIEQNVLDAVKWI